MAGVSGGIRLGFGTGYKGRVYGGVRTLKQGLVEVLSRLYIDEDFKSTCVFGMD